MERGIRRISGPQTPTRQPLGPPSIFPFTPGPIDVGVDRQFRLGPAPPPPQRPLLGGPGSQLLSPTGDVLATVPSRPPTPQRPINVPDIGLVDPSVRPPEVLIPAPPRPGRRPTEGQRRSRERRQAGEAVSSILQQTGNDPVLAAARIRQNPNLNAADKTLMLNVLEDLFKTREPF